MTITHIEQIETRRLEGESLKGCNKQVLIGPEQGWETHVMRRFSIAEGGYTPRHSHSWPHIIYVTAGSGVLFAGGKEHLIHAGSTAFVDPDTIHQFINDGRSTLEFLCIVPTIGES